MKTKKANLIILLILVLSITASFRYGWAKAKQEITPPRLAVVNIDKVLQNCKKHANWQETMNQQEQKIRAELEKLSKELDAVKADINTRQPGSQDYMKLMQEYMERNASLEAKDKFYEQQMTLEVQQWTEKLYQDVRANVEKVAKERDLDIVIAKDDFLPETNARELMTQIKTSKVLYHAEHLDITDDVLAMLDAGI